jgi:hypothetical protein
MSGIINVACPQCKQQIRAPAEALGKKVRCKGCGNVFPLNPPKAAAKAQAKDKAKPKPPPHPKAADDLDDDGNPYDVTDLDLTPRCPHCAGEMESAEAIICLNCGYNTQTRQMGKTVKAMQNSFGDWVMWLGPAILCVLGVVAMAGVICYLWLPWFDINTFPSREMALPKDVDPETQKDKWLPARIWGGVVAAAFLWGCGFFAVKRLILNPHPPIRYKNV